MKLPVLVLSTALLCSTGAFAQTTTTAPDTATQTTGTATTGNTAPNTMNNTEPMNTGTMRDNGGGGGYGLWGLLGLFGFFGLARGGRRRDDLTTRTGTTVPPR